MKPNIDNQPSATELPAVARAAQRVAEVAVLLACAALCLNLSTSQIALLVAAGALVVLVWKAPTALRPAWQSSRPVLLAGAALVGAVVLAQLATPVGWTGLDWVQRCRAWLALLPLSLTLALGGATLRRRAVWLLLAGALVASVLGIVQHFTGVHPGAELLGVAPKHWRIRAPGQSDGFSAVGLFYNRTRFAHVIVVAAALALGLALWGRRPKTRWLAAALVVPVLAALVLSYTRAALGALVLALGLLLLLDGASLSRRLRRAVLAGMLALACVVAVVPSLRHRAVSAVDMVANSDRQFLWRRGFEIAADFGATGVGLNHYGLAHGFYYDQVKSTFGMRSQGHNLYLTFLAELGPIGLLALMGFLITLLRRGRHRGVGVDTEADDMALRRGALLAVLALMLISLFHDPLYQAVEALAFFTPAALLASLGESPEAPT